MICQKFQLLLEVLSMHYFPCPIDIKGVGLKIQKGIGTTSRVSGYKALHFEFQPWVLALE